MKKKRNLNKYNLNYETFTLLEESIMKKIFSNDFSVNK